MKGSTSHRLTVSFHGVRGSTPSPGNATARYGANTSCVEIRANDEILILDAGTGIRNLGGKLLAEFGEKPISACLIVSHTHWDHIQGLPFFTPAYSAQNSFRVLTAKGWGSTVARALRDQMDPIFFPVRLDQMAGLRAAEELDSSDVSLGSFRVRSAALNHPGGCAGFRVEANGVSVAYLPDHEPFHDDVGKMQTDLIAEFVRDVDLLILDTQYTVAEFQQRRGWGHGCLVDSVALAVNAGVRELAMFHHDPAHTDDQMDAIVEGGRYLAGVSPLLVNAARESDTIVLERTRSSERLAATAAA